jgi:AraC-like DNA-binding protein
MEVILWVVLSGFAVLVTALVVSLHYHRKYSPVLRQISERLSDKESGDKAPGEADKTAAHPENPTDEPFDYPVDIVPQETAKEARLVEDADELLFRQLTDAIRNEQLYTVPKFGRTELVERFHLSSKRISTAFSKGGTSVPEFIRECRLEHARQLMIERPDMTLIEIAAASGFVHASTFTVDFKNKYGASPTKYREEQQKENPDENY